MRWSTCRCSLARWLFAWRLLRDVWALLCRARAAAAAADTDAPAPTAASVRSPLARRRMRRDGDDGSLSSGGGASKDVRALMTQTVLCGVAVLSLAPHQEARFLLPLVTPLAVLSASWLGLDRFFERELVNSAARAAARRARLRRVWRVAVWLLFNLGAIVVLGIAHQGGLMRSMTFLHDNAEALGGTGGSAGSCRPHVRRKQRLSSAIARTVGRPTTILFYATYTPPQFLLMQEDEDASAALRWRLPDALPPNTYDVRHVFRGDLHASLDDVLAEHLARAMARRVAPLTALHAFRVLLVAPRTALQRKSAESARANNATAELPLFAPVHSSTVQVLEQLHEQHRTQQQRRQEEIELAEARARAEKRFDERRNAVLAASYARDAGELMQMRAQFARQLLNVAALNVIERGERGSDAGSGATFEYRFEPLHSIWPHLTLEDPPAALGDMALDVLRVKVDIFTVA